MSGGNYSSATTYGDYVNGSGNSQWNRTMDQSGAYGQIPGNTIIGVQGQNVIPPSQMPTSAQTALIQTAGGKYRKGGFLGEVINQAIVPFGLLGLQQSYGRKRKGGKTSKKRGGFIAEAVNQAIVPLAVLGLQQSYGRKRKGGKTRKHH
jgi:hypothetical protein